MKTSNSVRNHSEQELTKAVSNLAKFYSLTGKDLSKIIGISECSASRISQGTKIISPNTEDGEMALLLSRVYMHHSFHSTRG